MFALHNTPGSEIEIANMKWTVLQACHDTAKFDLSLGFAETETGLAGEFEYRTDLFEPDTRSIPACPDTPVWSLPVLTEADKQRLFVEWNETVRNLRSTSVCTSHSKLRQHKDRTRLPWSFKTNR